MKKEKTKEIVLPIIVSMLLLLITACIVIPVLQPAAPINSSGTCGDNLTWTLDADGTLTISGTGELSNIDNWSGNSENIKSVKISDGVTKIGQNAFINCTSLTDITIPDSVKGIGAKAFQDCTMLKSIIIPDGLKYIVGYAFQNCTSLVSIIIPDSVTDIGDGIFLNCTSLVSVIIPNGVTYIGKNVFQNCMSLADITFSNVLTSIDNYAFCGCVSLTDITIPDSVKYIGDNAFNGCTSLTSITIPDGITEIGYNSFVDTEYYKNESNWENGVLYIGHYLITAQSSVSDSYSIRPGTITIGNYAFIGCSLLEEVTIPDSVMHINIRSFNKFSSLTIYGYDGSYAQKYAEDQGISFAVIV